MGRIKASLIVVNLVLLMVYFNWSVSEKEKTIKDGKLVLLRLAPVDPRSLMQGDYMNLNYMINNLKDSLPDQFKVSHKRGYCIVKENAKGFADAIRFQPDLHPLKNGEIAIKYFSENGGSAFSRIHIGAESFFFEEGQAKRFENAKYGGLRVDHQGNSVLVGLYDEKLRQLGHSAAIEETK